MRLYLTKLVAIHHAQSGHAVGNPPLMQLLQARNLLRAGRDHQLAALLEWNTLLLAKALHGSSACDAVLRLQRTGFVVETGMDNPAIVTRLMGRDMIFLLHHHHLHSGEPSRGVQSGS